MIGVLIGHIIDLGHCEKTDLVSVLYWLCILIHTNGFLMLSGFGLFYSLSKDNNILRFYKRRFFRFLFPFLLMAIPYFFVVTLNKEENIWYYLSCISTIEFWLHGNYYGMWYIAISLILYILTPLCFRLVANYKCRSLGIMIFIIAAISLNLIIAWLLPNYWDKVKIGLTGVPYFFTGLWMASLVKGSRDYTFLVISVSILIYFFLLMFDFMPFISGIVSIIVFSLLFSTFFSLLSLNRVMQNINSFVAWFGKYSLELYILHLYFWFIIKEVFNMGANWNIAIACLLSMVCCVPMHYITVKVSNLIQRRFCCVD